MKIILVFEPWILGAKIINLLQSLLPGFKFIFIHCSSLQNGNPKSVCDDFDMASIQDLALHEFSEFNYSFGKLFKVFRPDSLLVLSLHGLEQRTALLAAKKYNIHTIFIPHGIYEDRIVTLPNNIKCLSLHTFPEKVRRLFYYLRFYLIVFIVKNRRLCSNWKLILLNLSSLLWNKYEWYFRPNFFVQLTYANLLDIAFVYDIHIQKHISSTYGKIVKGCQWIVTGSVNSLQLATSLDLSCFHIDSLGKDSILLPASNLKQAIFISTFPSPGYNNEYFLRFTLTALDILVSAGYEKVIYRPHPAENKDLSSTIMKNSPNIIIDNGSDLQALRTSSIVVGPPSSLLDIAIILKIKILMVCTNSEKLSFYPPYYTRLINEDLKIYDLFDQASKILFANECKNSLHYTRDPFKLNKSALLHLAFIDYIE